MFVCGEGGVTEAGAKRRNLKVMGLFCMSRWDGGYLYRWLPACHRVAPASPMISERETEDGGTDRRTLMDTGVYPQSVSGMP